MNKLKLTDKMISEIKEKVRNINFSNEALIVNIAFKNVAKIDLGVKNVKLIDHELEDAYTYTVNLRATGTNKYDYFNYEIHYIAIEDKTTSAGYKIDNKYDFTGLLND